MTKVAAEYEDWHSVQEMIARTRRMATHAADAAGVKAVTHDRRSGEEVPQGGQ
ncbi:MAG: hypothetical protein R3E87_19825 [Burkholderiaceae bacterium]